VVVDLLLASRVVGCAAIELALLFEFTLWPRELIISFAPSLMEASIFGPTRRAGPFGFLPKGPEGVSQTHGDCSPAAFKEGLWKIQWMLLFCKVGPIVINRQYTE
jgi:hypothetical protein